MTLETTVLLLRGRRGGRGPLYECVDSWGRRGYAIGTEYGVSGIADR